jgi:formylglycine-generating enzyme required for sulfatase activity
MNPEESTYFINLRSMIDLVNNWNQLPQNKKAKIARSLTLSVKEYSSILHTLLDQQNQLPVNQVSYTQAVSYCHKLTEYGYKNNLIPGRMIYRLPTEAEWEFACRAGLRGACGIGEGNELSGLNANIDGGTKDYIIGDESTLINRGKLIPVGNKFSRFSPNRWGLSDMHGSVMEWCYDFYDQYPEELAINPIGPLHGKNRVLRGGSFYRTAYESRSANRESSAPSWRGSEIGFRVVLGYPLR